MDIRTMQYFLAVIREGTISAAAESLHVAQPSLSRQMKDLEEDLGVTLFERGNRKITLTEEGQVLRRRAEELVRLMQLTQEEIAQVKHRLTGSIRIGAGESQAFRYFAETAATLLKEHPDVQLHITSGDTQDLMDELDNGLIDFALIFTEFDREKYRSIQLPAADRFGVLMRGDNPLASKSEILLAELAEVPLMISRASQSYWESVAERKSLKIIGTYNLIFNASLLVESGACCALGFEKLINTTGESPLCFRPLAGQKKTTGALIWKKYQTFSPAVQLFIDQISSFLYVSRLRGSN
jgi:DNA-binding transcriptional LysR family regulator